MSAEIKLLIDSFSDNESLKEGVVLLEDYYKHLSAIDKIKINIGKSSNVGVIAAETAELKKLQTQLEKVKVENGKVADSKKKVKTVTAEQIRDEVKYNQVIAGQKKDLKDQINLNKAKAGSIDYLRARLSIVTKQYNALSEAEREQTIEGKNLAASKLELTEKLKSLEKATGDHRREVGNYGIALGTLSKGLGGLSNIIQKLGGALGINTDALEVLQGVTKEFLKTSKEIVKVQKLKKAAIQENIVAEQASVAASVESTVATEAQTVATEGAEVAQKALNKTVLANPYFLAAAALVALVAVITSYVHVSEAAEAKERERSKSIDGLIIKDKDLRESHNETIFTLRELDIEYGLLIGTITEFEGAMLSLSLENDRALNKIEEDTNEKLTEAEGYWHQVGAAIKEVGTSLGGLFDLSGAAGKSQEEIAAIEAAAAQKRADQQKVFDQKKVNAAEAARKKEYDAIVAGDEDINRQKLRLNNEMIDNEHERNIASINETALHAEEETALLVASEYKKQELLEAIRKKQQHDLNKENERHYKEMLQKKRDRENKTLEEEARVLEDARARDLANNEISRKKELEQEGNTERDLLLINQYYDRLKTEINKKWDDEDLKRQQDYEKKKQKIIDDAEQLRVKRLSALKKREADLANRNAPDKSETEQEKERFKKELAELEDIRTKAEALGVYNEQKYYDDLELIHEKHEANQREIDEKIAEEKKKQQQEDIEQAVTHAEELGEKLLAAAMEKSEKELKVLNDAIGEQNRVVEEQRRRAEKGQSNNLAFEEREKAKLERAAIEEQKRQEKLKKAEAYWSLLATFAKSDGDEAAQKALLEIAEGMAISAAFREKGGMGSDATETTTLKNGEWSKSHASGDILTMISPKEGILTEQNVAALGGKDGFYQLKHNLETMASNPLSDDLFAKQNESFTAVALHRVEAVDMNPVVEQLQRVERAVKNITIEKHDINSLGNYIHTLQKQGSRIVTDKGQFVRAPRKKYIG